MLQKVRSTPKYRVRADGRDLAGPLAAALREIHVDQSVEMADMATLVFKNERARVSDEPSLRPGARVQVELGYEEGGGRTLPVIDGEVVAIKASFPRRGPSSARIQVYSKHHRLRRGRFTRAFKGLSYSGIARRIAQEVGLEATVDETQPAFEMVFQRNQTNLEFLCELAAMVGHEVFVRDGRLFFRRPASGGAKVRTFKKGEDLLAFNPWVRAALMPTEVSVLGWRFDGEPIAGEAREGDEGPSLGGSRGALAIARELGDAPLLIRGTVVADDAAANALARAALQAAAQNLVAATAHVSGAPDIRPGLVVEIAGVGEIFSGMYYVRRVLHNYLPSGFATTLELARGSILPPSPGGAPAPGQAPPAEEPPPGPAAVVGAVGPRPPAGDMIEGIEPPPVPPGRPSLPGIDLGLEAGGSAGKTGKA